MESPSSPEKSDPKDREVELPAPPGWKKKLVPKKVGAGERNEVVFISPTGQEIRQKKHLSEYLKKQPGELLPADFDWGPGEHRRRSLRISEKEKATSSPEDEPERKRGKKSSSTEEA